MSKFSISLKLQDMYAIKHALKSSIYRKQKKLEGLDRDISIMKAQLTSDIEHETRLLETITTTIESYKSQYNIGGAFSEQK